MSMILDALTRAEHERQLEKQPDLKFVDPVKPQKNNINKIWLWVGLGLLVNILVIFLIFRALSDGNNPAVEMAATQEPSASQKLSTVPPTTTMSGSQQVVQQSATNSNVKQQTLTPEVTIQHQALEPIDSRPLAMELENSQVPKVDRPLIYESKQANVKSEISVPQPSNTASASTVKKGQVSFSATELSVDDATPIVEKPKLLIEQGEPVALNTQSSSTSNVLNLRDLPDSTRNRLNQYEVNVHVFDDDPIRRFVLINMDKYKEGDRIANNGPLVEEITSAGVVIDYGSGRALIPPK